MFDATNRRGVTPMYCSNSCKQKAYRARKRRSVFGLDGFKDQRRWVRAVGKRPIMPDGSPASSTDSSTWSTFGEVWSSTVGDGFGVMLGGGLGCIDIDDCLDGDRVAPWAREYIAGITDEVVFVERSVSGRGLHLFFRAPVEGKGEARGVERYTCKRFIRTTFDEFVG